LKEEKYMVEKNNEYIVDIIDNGYEGEGIAKIDGFTIFIPGAIKGENKNINSKSTIFSCFWKNIRNNRKVEG
jgi:predicted RNA-binding protein with TRAM domain